LNVLNLWHAEDREVVLHRLGADAERGLAPAESTRRLREHGPNTLSGDNPSSGGWLVLRQVLDPLALAPLIAAALSVRIGEWVAGALAGAAGAANALLGASRERPARGRGMELARLSAPAARVVRGGRSFLIPAAELVPGDLAEVAAGDRVPADIRLCRAHSLVVDESSLTGAALPVGKDGGETLPEQTPLADRSNMLYAGTLVTGGDGSGIVIATGTRTELGRIAGLLAEATAPPPPLRRRVRDLGQVLALAGLACAAAATVALRLRGESATELMAAASCLALASVPVGLPAAIALALAAGVRGLRQGGARTLTPATAETLGGVSVIVTEKTGTLTRNEMTVRELFLEEETIEVTGSGYAPEGRILRRDVSVEPAQWETLEIALRIGALCSTAVLRAAGEGVWRIQGDPIEGALQTLAAKGGLWRDDLLRRHPLLAVYPFTLERRRMTVVAAGRGGRPTALMKGAPDVVLAHCLHHRTAAGVRPLSPADRERFLQRAEEMSGRALRVLGLAYREDAAGGDARSVERSLVWVGLVGMLDPPHEGVAEAVGACLAAGMEPVIVTGDRPEAALALAREIGALRPGDRAVSGEELDLMTPEALGACVERYRVCARANAEHKLRVVRAWKGRGRCTAVIGNGVIDAPALREADVGVALGRGGSDIAREEAAVAIEEGGFASLAAAVTRGTGVRENLARVTGFFLALAAGQTLVLLAATLTAHLQPLTPLRLIWLALVAGLLPAAALGAAIPGEGAQPQPRGDGRDPVLNREWSLLALAGGAGIAVAAGAAFLAARVGEGGGVARAGTHVLAVMSLSPLGVSFGFRHRRQAFFAGLFPAGGRLVAAAALSALMTAAVIQVPQFGGLLGTVGLGRGEWLGVAGLSLLPLVAVEAGKAWLRARRRSDLP
jgi:Ca2+-transporting ATPase